MMRLAFLSGAALALTLAACSGEPDQPQAPAKTGEEVFPQQPEAAPQGRFAPRNECVELTGAKAFLLKLETAVKDRDAETLITLFDPKVKLDFGGGAGTTMLRERLADKEGKLWTELDQILSLGCAHDESGTMTLPWYFAQDMNDIDTANAMLVTGADIPVRKSASATGEQLDTVSWDAVELTKGYDPKAKFLEVRTPSGKTGFVAAENLRSMLDYRLTANRDGDSWRITSFVNGD